MKNIIDYLEKEEEKLIDKVINRLNSDVTKKINRTRLSKYGYLEQIHNQLPIKKTMELVLINEITKTFNVEELKKAFKSELQTPQKRYYAKGIMKEKELRKYKEQFEEKVYEKIGRVKRKITRLVEEKRKELDKIKETLAIAQQQYEPFFNHYLIHIDEKVKEEIGFHFIKEKELYNLRDYQVVYDLLHERYATDEIEYFIHQRFEKEFLMYIRTQFPQEFRFLEDCDEDYRLRYIVYEHEHELDIEITVVFHSILNEKIIDLLENTKRVKLYWDKVRLKRLLE